MPSNSSIKTDNNQIDDETDLLEEMLNKTGCKKIHYTLQECMFENKDWRKCQHLVNDLRECMLNYERKRAQNPSMN